jgi:hypothetical protein
MKEMHDEALLNLANSVDINEFRRILKPILVERVVGTPGHETVKNVSFKFVNRA